MTRLVLRVLHDCHQDPCKCSWLRHRRRPESAPLQELPASSREVAVAAAPWPTWAAAMRSSAAD
ncbi:unnamed protein product [Polarella glacialis]|uniref:Uncharacterized protein n=1 Tax=Polarella glacialis TaxID=89957 RepID=A0A813J6C3_POLGL|nr:unnamed protein product [Polarella glacialis]